MSSNRAFTVAQSNVAKHRKYSCKHQHKIHMYLVNKQHGVLHELGLRQFFICPEVAGFYLFHSFGQPGQEKVPAPSAVQKLLQPPRIALLENKNKINDWSIKTMTNSVRAQRMDIEKHYFIFPKQMRFTQNDTTQNCAYQDIGVHIFGHF